MNETLEFLKKSIRDSKLKEKSTEELVKIYQETKDDQVIAIIYCRDYKSIKFLESKKLLIDEDQRTSIILETIERCLLRHNSNSEASFLTYLNNAIDYNLWTYIDCYLKHKGRDKYTVSFDELSDLGISITTTKTTQEDLQEFENIDFEALLNNLNLTKNELTYCKLVAFTPNITVNEIAKALNIQRVSVWYLKNRLKEKLSFLRRF